MVLKKENHLFYNIDNETFEIDIPNLDFSINDFFVTNETLYIYGTQTLKKFKLNPN